MGSTNVHHLELARVSAPPLNPLIASGSTLKSEVFFMKKDMDKIIFERRGC